MAQDVFIGTGSNLGDRLGALDVAAALLEPKAQSSSKPPVFMKHRPGDLKTSPHF